MARLHGPIIVNAAPQLIAAMRLGILGCWADGLHGGKGAA